MKKGNSNIERHCDSKIYFFSFLAGDRFFYSSNLLIEFSFDLQKFLQYARILAASRGLYYFLLSLSLSFIVSNLVSSSFLSNKTLSQGITA